MRPAHLEISLTALRYNFHQIQTAVGKTCSVIPVIKANAYGHGLIRVAGALEEEGAKCLAVALVQEGIELREAGIRCPILVLGAALPQEAEEIISHQLIQTVCTEEVIRALAKEAGRLREAALVQIKVDTGMGRLGIPPGKAPELLELCASLPGVMVTGIWSHFATADEEDPSFTEEQFRRFSTCFPLKKKHRFPIQFHICNSAGIINFPHMHLDAVRPGLVLYGLKAVGKERLHIDYRRVMSLKSRLAFVKKCGPGQPISYGRTFVTKRETLVATVPVGYADGYPRHLSNRGLVLIRGQRLPILGSVCMDQFLVDVTPLDGVMPGEEVVLIGEQRGARITANELAVWGDTIVNEIVSRLGERLPRVFIDEQGNA